MPTICRYGDPGTVAGAGHEARVTHMKGGRTFLQKIRGPCFLPHHQIDTGTDGAAAAWTWRPVTGRPAPAQLDPGCAPPRPAALQDLLPSSSSPPPAPPSLPPSASCTPPCNPPEYKRVPQKALCCPHVGTNPRARRAAGSSRDGPHPAPPAPGRPFPVPTRIRCGLRRSSSREYND